MEPSHNYFMNSLLCNFMQILKEKVNVNQALSQNITTIHQKLYSWFKSAQWMNFHQVFSD